MESLPHVTNRRIPGRFGPALNSDADFSYGVGKFVLPGSSLCCSSLALLSIILEFKFTPLKWDVNSHIIATQALGIDFKTMTTKKSHHSESSSFQRTVKYGFSL